MECEPHLHFKLWIYDLPTNLHFTLKENTLKRSDLDDFVACYNPKNRHERKPTWSEKNDKGRWREYKYEDLIKRDKVNLDIFWLKDEALEDSANLPVPEIIAADMPQLRAKYRLQIAPPYVKPSCRSVHTPATSPRRCATAS